MVVAARGRWAAVAAALVLCGCGSDAASPASTATSIEPTTTTAAAATTPLPSTTAAPMTTAATVPATDAPTTTLACPALTDTDVKSDGFPGQLSGLVGADVRAGADACHERVVFELQGTGEFPGWWVRYQAAPLTDDPRGEPVDVAGSAFIVVTIESWMTTMEGDGYKGPTRITPTNVAHLRELVMLGNFESVTTWAIGVDQQRPFKVSTLSNPPRLVIDVATS